MKHQKDINRQLSLENEVERASEPFEVVARRLLHTNSVTTKLGVITINPMLSPLE